MDIFDEIKRDAAAGDMPTNNELGQISAMVSELLTLDDRIAKGNALLTQLNDQRNRLSEVSIPTAMAAIGLAKVTLESGHTLEIKPEVYAAIRADFKNQAFQWLDEHGLGDVVKSEVTYIFGRGEEELSRSLIAMSREQGYGNYKEKRSVHPQTLVALIREQRALGKEFPEEYFSIADIAKTKIKIKA